MNLSSTYAQATYGQCSYAAFGASIYVPPAAIIPPTARTFNPSDCGPITIHLTPPETIDYAFDWTMPAANSDDQAAQYQLETDEIITSSIWIANGIDILFPASSIQNSGTLTVVWLSGGIAGNSYIVTNTVTTSLGRIYTASFNVVVGNFN